MPGAEDQAIGRVEDAVHEVHVPALGVIPDPAQVAAEVGVGSVVDADVALCRHESEGQLGENAERAERAVHHREDQSILVFRRALQDHAVGGDHLLGQAAVVEPAMRERHRLERAAGDGAAQGDRR